MIRREENPRKQGDAGVGVAISWFTRNGYTVCIPLSDTQPYDLIVDDGKSISRVFVRTTTQKEPSGNYIAGLRTLGGNKTQMKIRNFDSGSVELVFIACENGCCYLIPPSKITAKTAVTLGPKYSEYRVE